MQSQFQQRFDGRSGCREAIGVIGRSSLATPGWFLAVLSEALLQELHNVLAAVKAVPRLGNRITEDAARQRPMVLARIGDHLDLNSGLAKGAIHFLGLAKRIGNVGFALQQQKWSFSLGRTCERALLPGVFHTLPGFAEVPAVVPGTSFRSVFAELIDYRRAADDCFEAVCFA